MSREEEMFFETGKKLKEASEGKLFGKPCFKVNGKAFMCLFEKCTVFKLEGKSHKEALTLGGSQLFDPSKSGRQMKEWVQVPFNHNDKWDQLAKAAYKYVQSSTE
jgi:hypothetical protein